MTRFKKSLLPMVLGTIVFYVSFDRICADRKHGGGKCSD